MWIVGGRGWDAGAVVAIMIALVPVLTACGARGEPEQIDPGTVLARNALPGLTGRTCRFVSEPEEIPAFARLARMGTRGNIALWGLYAEPSDSVMVSIRYDEEGRLGWVRVIRSSLTPDRTTSLEQLLRESVNERGPADWGVRLRVVAGQFAGLEPSVICPAELRRSGGGPVLSLPPTERGLRALERARGRRFRVRIAIDEQGRVVDVRLPGVTGDRAVDQFLLDWARAARFHPKLHDGVGVPTTVNQSIYLRRRQ